LKKKKTKKKIHQKKKKKKKKTSFSWTKKCFVLSKSKDEFGFVFQRNDSKQVNKVCLYPESALLVDLHSKTETPVLEFSYVLNVQIKRWCETLFIFRDRSMLGHTVQKVPAKGFH